MGYVKVKYQRMLDILDDRYYLPTGWDEFVEKNSVKHNLIFKGSKSRMTTPFPCQDGNPSLSWAQA